MMPRNAATKKIHWVNENPGAAGDEGRYLHSMEGRFQISPNFRHTVWPDSYTVVDRLPKGWSTASPGVRQEATYDTIGECKRWALDRI